jgi:exodeoxyribonuclease V alpha subunit
MTGRFMDHAQFGRQFQVSRARLLPPKTEAGLKKYLGSGLIKGVGPVLAGRLVDYFGPAVLEVLERTPEKLIEVPGLGANRRETIIEGWRRNQGLKRLLGFLAEFGLGPTVGLRAIRRLGEEAESLIREDPYRLAYDIDGVGFATADKVARRLGLDATDPRRLAAGLLFALDQFADEGHVYTSERELMAAGAKLLPEAEPANLKEALARLFLSGQIQSGAQDEPEAGVDIYQPRLRRAEDWVARDLLAILRTPATIEVPRQPQAVAWAEKALGLNLSDSQRQAVALALSQKILVITGGPGTGKTTLTRAITAIFGALRARLGLVAPTGRAARRLAEATGLAAKTVHRLLEYAPQVGFQRHPERKLELDLLLVDEVSMVDLPLMNQLTGALPHAARLILVGDRDQLPSVGPGRVLADLIDSQVVSVVRLTEVHRQAEGSQIVRAAHQVRRGEFPDSSQDQDNGDFFFLEEKDPNRIQPRLLQLLTKTLPARRGLNPLDVQVLTPMHGRALGTEELNQVLSERLNHQENQGLIRFGRRFRPGDRVMQLKNNYNKEIFNGDGGLVERIDHEAQEMTVNFEGRSVIYDFSELDELTLAYAITIHKAQGSEFPAVIIPLTSSHHIMLRRNLLYTGLTRGRRLVILLGSARALEAAVANDREQVRRSNLARKLRDSMN